MFPGSNCYGNQFQPERVRSNVWHVWHEAGALDVLRLREFEAPGRRGPYTILFANGSAARLVIGDAIWSELQDIATKYQVSVLPLRLGGKGFVPWSGEDSPSLQFDTIRIEGLEHQAAPRPSDVFVAAA